MDVRTFAKGGGDQPRDEKGRFAKGDGAAKEPKLQEVAVGKYKTVHIFVAHDPGFRGDAVDTDLGKEHLGGVKAKHVVGMVRVVKDPEGGTAHAGYVEVSKDARRRGIASKLYDHAEKALGVKMRPSPNQTPEGAALWKSRAAQR